MNDENTQTNEEIEQLKAQVEELTDTAKRAVAELQNSKKRMEEEKSHFAKFASANVFMHILPVFDSLERAKQNMPEDLAENDWALGIEAIVKQFEGIMEQFKITKMKTVGEKFDPNFHEAVASGKGEKDTITEELEGGYMMEDQALRAAKVKVGDGT
ncbi:nucleotide exchange factor GrpE [Patescibacteria group bacterium]